MQRVRDRHGERPDRRRQRDVDHDEPPRQGVAVLDLADGHLRSRRTPNSRAPAPRDPGQLAAEPPEEEPDDEEADPEDRGRAHVDVHGVGDAEPEAWDVLPARVRARGRRDRPGDDEDRAGARRRPPRPCAASAGRPGGRARVEWLHASSATTTAPARTMRASRKWDITAIGLRPSSTVMPPSGICAIVPSAVARARFRTQRGSPSTRRAGEPDEPPSRSDPDERDEAVAELDRRVAALLGIRLVAAARPVVAAEPERGQPNDRAARDDDPEREDGSGRELGEPAGRDQRAAPAPSRSRR